MYTICTCTSLQFQHHLCRVDYDQKQASAFARLVSLPSIGIAILSLLCCGVLLTAICLMVLVLTFSSIIRRLPSIDPGQQRLQQCTEGAHLLQLLLVQLGCWHQTARYQLPTFCSYHHAAHAVI